MAGFQVTTEGDWNLALPGFSKQLILLKKCGTGELGADGA
jgi:hypothetical protein